MAVWKIKPLYYGKITGNKSLLTPGIDADVVADSPYLGFLLQDGKRNILVDTGIADEFIVDGKAWAGLPAEGGKVFVQESLPGAPDNLTVFPNTSRIRGGAYNSSELCARRRRKKSFRGLDFYSTRSGIPTKPKHSPSKRVN